MSDLLSAFTGSFDAGAEIFWELERLFGKDNTGPSIWQINKALQKFNIQFRHDPNILIGWTCRSRSSCFKWKAGLNSSAAAVPYAIEGSGNFVDVLTNKGGPHHVDFDRTTGVLSRSGRYSSSARTAFQKAILSGLLTLGSGLTDEVFRGRNLEEAYGYGGEIALYTGKRFEFVSGIGFFFWTVRIEQDGSCTLHSGPIKALYEARDRHCVFQVDIFSGVTDDNKYIFTPYTATLTPFHYGFEALGLPNPKPLTQECSYYFNGIVIHDMRSNQIIGPLKFAEFASDIPGSLRFFKIGDDVYRLAWNREYLADFIRWAIAETSKPGSLAGDFP